MRKVHAIIFISFIILSIFSISGITAPNEKLKIYFTQTPTFYSGGSGEFTITFDNTSNSNLKAVYIYLKDEFFEFSKNKFFYGEIQPGQKINEKVSYTVKNIERGNYYLKANTQYSYQVFCSGLKCDYTSEGFLVEIPFKVEGAMSPIIDIKPRDLTVNQVPYTLPIFFVNKGSAVKSSYVILNQEGNLFSFDYTEEVGPIQSLTKKEIIITKIPESPGEYTVFINLEIKDTNDKTSFLKFPLKLKIEGPSQTKTALDINSTEVITNENNNSGVSIQNIPEVKTKSSLFYIQEVVLVITLFALVVTFFLMLLSRR
ncbi:MAG: hypothetical protein AMQ74_00796 [Candidatus Methanofastidiosum methylothiophilum]|uniref:CARDB domain-containing protein n=1 Tax=Candidatus Methanofastidiosum methylothiophilum TaxID=1705564 RepID=A0A150J533_9EURY|nr:MAG: hypothetical protein AMQ74_00796 [Candidatus Methanofastidiosum methylthiophilus]NMC76215.1 hypothetical protein [Candidatus Methanofastidiosa archaeon]